MSKISKQALMIAAANHVRLEDGQHAAYAAYLLMKDKAASEPESLMFELDIEVPDSISSEKIKTIVDQIEYEANTLEAFGKSLLKAAHNGLIEAAIDGSLDSDANAWSLNDYAEAHIGEYAD